MDATTPAQSCATCGWTVQPNARFCAQCGTALHTGPAFGAAVAPARPLAEGRFRPRLRAAADTCSRASDELARVLRAWLGFARVLLESAWQSGRELLRLRNKQRRLEDERHELVSALGWAVYHDDEELTEALKSAAKACSDQIEGCDRARQEHVERARRRVSRERAAVKRTTVLAAADPGDDR